DLQGRDHVRAHEPGSTGAAHRDELLASSSKQRTPTRAPAAEPLHGVGAPVFIPSVTIPPLARPSLLPLTPHGPDRRRCRSVTWGDLRSASQRHRGTIHPTSNPSTRTWPTD